MNILLTLGRMPKALELTRGLAASGCRIVIADPHKNHVCRYSNSVSQCFQVTAPNINAEAYIQELLEIIRSQDIELVIPVSEESIYCGLLKDQLPEGVRFFGPGFEMARRLHDKYRFNQLLHEYGFQAPLSAALGSLEAEELVREHDVVVKPRHASAGIDVRFLSRGSRLPNDLARPSIVQQRMHGRLLTSLSVAQQGRCLATSVYEGTIFSGTVAMALRRVDDINPITSFVESLIDKLNYDGFISFDIFVDDNGQASAIECNPRLTSGIHLFDHLDVARAILNQTEINPIAYRNRRSFQHFWPCLGATEMSLLRMNNFRQHLQHFLSSADVTWSWQDPLPFFMMNFCTGDILKKTFFEKMSLGEAAITDIEWQEDTRLGLD